MVGKILFSPCVASFQEAPSLMLSGPEIIFFFKKYIFVKYAESYKRSCITGEHLSIPLKKTLNQKEQLEQHIKSL